ncbi:MAG: hypothetical protein Q9211_003949 [Gyalolechia sp. 1 TL-2023]
MAPRRVPSSAGLPDNWSTEMDEFICYSDAIGDLPVKVIIISLKKRFPSLNMNFHYSAPIVIMLMHRGTQFVISESAIERRLFCLDRMENDYFKKGSSIAVQRLESAGIRLPPEPDYDPGKEQTGAMKIGPAEPVTPVKQSTAQAGATRMLDRNNIESKGSPTARYHHDRYAHTTVRLIWLPLARYVATDPIQAKESSATIAGRISSEAMQHSILSESTIPTASSETNNIRPRVVTAGPAPSNSGRRPKDVIPTASLSHLRISEDNSQLGRADSLSGHSNSTLGSSVFPFGAKGRSNVQPLSHSSTVNPSLGFSSGSPRAAHGRIKPVASNSNMGSGRLLNDENTPLGASTVVDPPRENDGPALPSRRYL